MLDFKLLSRYIETQKEFYEYLQARSSDVAVDISYYDDRLRDLMKRDLIDILDGRIGGSREWADDDCAFLEIEGDDAFCAVTTQRGEFMPCLQPCGRCAWYRQLPVELGDEFDRYIECRKGIEKRMSSNKERRGKTV